VILPEEASSGLTPRSEGGIVAQALRVIACRYQQRHRLLRTHPKARHEIGRRLTRKPLQCGVKFTQLLAQGTPAPGQ
jgi:hypothetical protein